VDGQQYFAVAPNTPTNLTTWVFSQPQYLLLNVAVGGNWPGNPDGSTTFPQSMIVDYVRVYSRSNPGNCGAIGLTIPGFEMAGLSDGKSCGSSIGKQPLRPR
jgi:beta-glucanase (GH16 family)